MASYHHVTISSDFTISSYHHNIIPSSSFDISAYHHNTIPSSHPIFIPPSLISSYHHATRKNLNATVFVNSTDRRRIWSNRYQICSIPGTSGWNRQRIAYDFFEFRTVQQSWWWHLFRRFVDEVNRIDPHFFLSISRSWKKNGRRRCRRYRRYPRCRRGSFPPTYI